MRPTEEGGIPPVSGRRRHLAPTGRSQIGDLAVARLGEGRVPFLLSKHCADGANLVAGLIIDATGNLYGTTVNGGVAGGGGTLFELFAENMLTVSVPGPGRVTSSPAGINCPSTCSARFPQGMAVRLTETPASGWSFLQWDGACGRNGASGV